MLCEIRLDDIACEIGGNMLFADVTLSVGRGQVIVVCARSGCGKSSLLEIAAGLKPPLRGEIQWNGINRASLSKQEMVSYRQHTGYCFQQNALISNFTLFENCALPLRYHTEKTDAEIGDMVQNVLEKLKIWELRRLLPEALAAGQARLAAFARACIMDPDFFFIDELFTGLDPYHVKILYASFEEYCLRRAKTILMVSSMNEYIKQSASKLFTIHNGTITEGAQE